MLTAGVSDNEIMECRNAKAALCMTVDRSGKSRKALALDLGITESHLSRMLSVEYDVNLPQNKLVPFMAACGNIIYLRWLFLQIREAQPRITISFDGDLFERVESMRCDLADLVREVKDRSPGVCPGCGAQFALNEGEEDTGMWFRNGVRQLEFEAINAGVLV